LGRLLLAIAVSSMSHFLARPQTFLEGAAAR
jgi:hypothetical protein